MKVNVAICTWNRARLLDQTLTEMRKLHVPPGVAWEVLLVNNNCTDDTDAVIAKHAEGLPIRRLFEPQQGISHARNCVIAAADGDLVLWTDDDVLVDRNWMAEFVAAAEKWPSAAFFGGTIEPWFAVEPPRWIRAHFERLHAAFAVLQLGDGIQQLAANQDLYTANLAVRTHVLKQFSFDPRLGRVGPSQVRGEDTVLVASLWAAGHQGVWVGTARVRHYIPPERLTRRHVWDFSYGYGRALRRRDGASAAEPLWRGAPRWALRQYWSNRLASWFYAVSHGRRWLERFMRAATMRGIIDESRACARI